MFPKAFDLDKLGGDFSALKSALRQGKRAAVFYTTPAARCHLASQQGRFFLYVTPDRISARAAAELLQSYCDKEVLLITEKDDLLINAQNVLMSSLQERLSAITKLYLREACGAVISAEGLQQYFPSVHNFGDSLLTIKKGDTIPVETVCEKLALGGYRNEDMTEEAGTFAVRGDILDVWAVNDELPTRVEFFGDTVENIRVFTPDTMMTLRQTEELVASPKSDILLSQTSVDRTLKRLQSVRRNASDKLKELIDDVSERLTLNPCNPTLTWILPFIKEDLGTVFDYLPDNSLVVLDEVKAIDDKLRLNANAHTVRAKTFAESGEATAEHVHSLISRDDAVKLINGYTILGFQQVTSSNPIYDANALFNIKALPVSRYNFNYSAMVTDIKAMLQNGARIYIYAGNVDTAASIGDFLMENDLNSRFSEDGSENYSIVIVPQRLSRGFIYPSAHLMLIGTDDLIRRTEVRKKTNEKKRQNFVMPVKGDYVVHERHGIGISEGVVAVDTLHGRRDFYVVNYRGGDKLYLPVDQMDTLEKYVGGGTPTLHKIGGKEFDRVKERVKNSIRSMAIDLVGLYEKRMKVKGYKYQPDTVWQKELEDSFEFQETDDQLTAVAEIKEDMESGKIMDRLLCGDVGFGKTEVAIRAIFKTIMDGKQAAVLSPTTILCQQHYNTIKTRFNQFGIKIDVLSRFVSQSDIKESLKRIKSGETNVVVATHRLLSKDVIFHDLGLLVLDEEQKFGVEHKEKIKLLKNNVNVLSMSATPIPRTLHMSLSGIRDISTLETPPANRMPVETYVVEYSDALLKDAVRRELARNGQVFILYNRVQSLVNFYKHVLEVVDPEANVIYAHGQMDSTELEEKIRLFYNKEANVLISTTIIENGIDLPDANTLIVIDSDRLGLAELYQLRGRVGRSVNLAYAYFTVREGKVLTTDADKRLSALLNFTELGSGFKIAMQDMEIRGAGNIMGREQHGNMEKVGYDMYCKLLKECVGELKGVLPEVYREVEFLIDGDTSLPQDYITDNSHRVSFYKDVAALTTLKEQRALLSRLSDVYGAPPQSVIYLTSVGIIKNLARQIGIKTVVATAEGLALRFYDDEAYKTEGVFKALAEFSTQCVFTPSVPPSIVFDNKNKNTQERLILLEKFMLATVIQ